MARGLASAWRRLCAGVVQDVPLDLDRCESCRETCCSQERWLRCELRLTDVAMQLAAAPPSTTQSDFPCVS
jgi:hypothetical protein